MATLGRNMQFTSSSIKNLFLDIVVILTDTHTYCLCTHNGVAHFRSKVLTARNELTPYRSQCIFTYEYKEAFPWLKM